MKKALALLSGGIDSPVAIDVMKDKLKIDAVHFHFVPLTDEESIEKSKKLAKQLGVKKLYIIPFVKPQTEVVDKCNNRYFFVITRRIMFRAAEKLSKKNRYEFLITGENLGQVSSQTLDNMTVVDKALEIPILRPLLCFDKREIIDRAVEIDTFETSKGPEICCLLGPKHPATRAKLEYVEKEEEKLNIKKLIDDCLKNIEVVEF
ncbi:7-cyano-7-deazaguanine synthase [Candidatus Woesearchaeota archaeon]|nr:7-cyano-7-deazaguanine synthase [Candidatus Woesearchaeota archaeon]